MDRRLYLEVLGKLETAYIAAVPPEDRPVYHPELCECSAFSFSHLKYAGDCDGSSLMRKHHVSRQ
jgi:hypothetical protein